MIRIGIVGAGNMARSHAVEYAKISGCRVAAVCDVDKSRAEEFAQAHSITGVYSDIDAFLDSGKIDAVANVTPDALHASVALKAIAAGKHILSEKPLAVNYPEARRMADAARDAGIINMVNFSYRNSSAIHKAQRIVAAGDIGRVVHVEATYLQGWLYTAAWPQVRDKSSLLWRLCSSLGSQGVLGDLGVHIVDFATYPAGAVRSLHCRMKTFSEIKGEEYAGRKLDANDTAMITAELEGGALASITTTRWAVGQANTILLRIHGDMGGIRIDLDQSYTKLDVCRGKDVANRVWKTVDCGVTPNMYRRFIRSIRSGVNDQPDFERGAQVQKVLDACFESDRLGCAVQV